MLKMLIVVCVSVMNMFRPTLKNNTWKTRVIVARTLRSKIAFVSLGYTHTHIWQMAVIHIQCIKGPQRDYYYFQVQVD